MSHDRKPHDRSPNAATKHALGRRELGRRAAGAIAATALAGTGSALAQAPRRGGRLRVAMGVGSPNDTIDPHKAVSATDGARIMNLYSRLVTVSPELQPVGDLAEGWESDASGTNWIFRLRAAEFHDGRRVRPADVIYSFRRIMDPATASPAKSLFDQIDPDGLAADGTSNVRIKLRAPNADFPALLAGYHAQVVPEGTTSFERGIGSGPFKLKSFRPGVESVMERHPAYYKQGQPYLDELVILGISEPAARVNALLSGEVELIEKLDPPLIDRVRAAPHLQIITAPSGFHVTFIMQADQPPFDNPDVRNALKMLIDRPRYVEIVYKGYGTVGNDHPISEADPFYCREIPARGYDPAAARALLARAGLNNPTFELHTSTILPGMLEGALVFKEMALAAGVTINVVRNPTDGYFTNVWMKKPFHMSGWTMRPVADIIFTQAYLSSARWNDTNWRRPAFDQLVLEARSTTDPARRQALYCQAQRMIRDDGGVIVPAFSNVLDAGLARVKGVLRHPLGTLGLWQWDGVWLDR